MREEISPTESRTFFMRSAPISVGVCVSIMLFIVAFVVPRFEKTYKEMELGVELPFITKILLEAGNLANEFWYVLPGVVFVAVWITAGVAKDRRGAVCLRYLLIPLMGCVVAFIAIALVLPLVSILERIVK